MWYYFRLPEYAKKVKKIMSEQKHNTWQQRPFYWRIPILFGLLGGGLGGLFMGVMEVSNIFLFMVLGAIYGFIPALITGLAAMLFQLQRDVSGIIATVVIGTLVSLIYGFLMSNQSSLLHVSFAGMLAILGGVSALILSFFVLPIPQENTPTPPINSE